MNAQYSKVLTAALALPDDQRSHLVIQLRGSLDRPPGISVDDPQFAAELDRRMDEYDRGESEACDWAEARDRIADQLRGLRSE